MPAHLLACAASTFLAVGAPASALEPSAFFDGAAPAQAADRDVAVRAGTIVRQAAVIAEPSPARRMMQAAPPAPDEDPSRLTAPAIEPPKKEGGFMDGLKSILNWDKRSLPAFAIGMGIGLGIVYFSGMLLATPLLGILGGIFAGLIIGFMLNAFKGP